MNIKINSLAETEKLAALVARTVQAGTVIALNGGLGAGKTTFTRALVHSSGSKANVTSPTFVILNIYQGGRLPVYHFDLYRLQSPADLENIGGTEFIPPVNGVAIIEWAEKMPDILPADYLEINIAIEDEAKRLFSFKFEGNTAYLKKVLAQWPPV